MFRIRLTATCAALLTSASAAVAQTKPAPWFEVQSATVAARYRLVEDSKDVRTANHLQENNAFKARLKAEPKGRVWVNVGMFTGSSFTGSWNNTGVGTGEQSLKVSLKQLFVSATPVKGVEGQVGSLYMARGENTEITSYDNDAYLAGERVTVKRPKQLYFDEVSLTHGYLGDVNTPSVLDRADRLGESNYRQVLVGKKLGSRLAVSADWTDTTNGTTWRAAAAVKVPAVVSAVRVEYYARPGDDVQGAAIAAERKLAHGVAVSGGWANVDAKYGGLNGDRYNRGERLFGGVSTPIYGPLSASVFYTHAIDNAFAVPVDQRFDAIMTWNVLETVKTMAR
jgi:hypothetical protein